MNILLVNAGTSPKGFPSLFPVHLAYIGSYLIDRGHQVRVLDLDHAGKNFENLYRIIGSETRYDLIGVSYRNLSLPYWLKGFKKLQKLLSTLKPHTDLLVVGGASLTLYPELVFSHIPEADVGVIGEGEFTLAAIADNPDDYRRLEGICYHDRGQVIINPRGKPLDGSAIPLFREVQGLDFKAYESVALQTYRGCVNTCPACTLPPLHGRGIRLRPFEDIIADMYFLYDHGVRHIYIIDAEFNLPWGRSNQVVDMFLNNNPGLTWEAFLRPDSRLNEDFLIRAEKAGCVRWHVDFMTGDPGWLARLQQNMSFEDIEHTISLLTERRIEIRFSFTFDFPQETLAEEWNTLKKILKIHSMGVPWKRFLVYPYFPTPAAEFGRQAVDLNRVGLFWHIKRTMRFMTRLCTPLFFFFIINNRKILYGPPEG